MLTIKNCKLFILLTLLIVCCNGSRKGKRALLDVKKCKTTSYPSDCPDNAQCSQSNYTSINEKSSNSNPNPSIEGVCTCIKNYVLNQHRLNDAEYCRLLKKDNNADGDGDGDDEDGDKNGTSMTTITTTTALSNKLPRTEAATAEINNVSSDAHQTKSSTINNVAPSSHHILGGIFISICVVLIFVIGIIGYRKLQLKQRWRNLLMPSGRGGGIGGGGGGVGVGISGNSRGRRGRPLYEDVMLSNDTDDPPLI